MRFGAGARPDEIAAADPCPPPSLGLERGGAPHRGVPGAGPVRPTSRPAPVVARAASGCYRRAVTYNFDPDRWYERERARLELEHARGVSSDAELERALAALEQRYQEMLDRLDGTFELPRSP